MKMRIMAIATFFVVLMMSFGAVSAADSNVFTNVNIANSGPLNVNIVTTDDNPITLQGTLNFKGIQYKDYTAVKAKWTSNLPIDEFYYINVYMTYTDLFGDVENNYVGTLYVENGTTSISDVIPVSYMDMSKPVDIIITAEKFGPWDDEVLD